MLSLIESSRGQYPTWKKVCCELPILLYVLILTGFLLPPKLPIPQTLIVGCCGAGFVLAFLLRVSRYSTKREVRLRMEFLASQRVFTQKIEEAKVRVMGLIEKKEFIRRDQLKRVSRYERPPVI